MDRCCNPRRFVQGALDFGVGDRPTRGGMAGRGPVAVTRADPLQADGLPEGPTTSTMSTSSIHPAVPSAASPQRTDRTRPRARSA